MTGTCDFGRIFNPESVAIVGVSPNPGFGFGRGMFYSLSEMGFAGRIYPVNPKGGTIEGLKIYKTVDEIPEEIDFAVIAVAAHRVPEALEACRKKGAAGAEILSAGFSEMETPEGIALEEEIKRIARKGIRVIGPNCFGIYCPESGLTLLPGPDLSRESGQVAFLSQSGGMSIDFAHIGKWMGMKFSKVVSFGNGADLRETELLEYLRDDSDTGVITMYIEGVENGRDFFLVLRSVAERKPVIVYKGGLSISGGRAVTSHTASMGGSGVIWESALRQCNAVQVGGIMEMARTSMAFSLLPHKIYRGVAVMGGGGALGVNACDIAELLGIEVPRLKREIEEKILSMLPRPGSSAGNPIDVANPYVSAQVLKDVLLLAAGDEKIDLQIIIHLLYHYKALARGLGANSIRDVAPCNELADGVKKVVDITGKPVIVVLPNIKQEIESMDIEEVMREARKAFLDRGVPGFDDIRDALEVVSRVSDYCRKRPGTPMKEVVS